MATSSKKTLLAIQIVEENFGKITAEVARYIIRHENNTINEIIRYFHRQTQSKSGLVIKPTQVRDALLILLQHNCLRLEPDTSVEVTDGEASVFWYRIDLDMVINRLRFPKFIAVVDNLYGNLAVQLAEELIFHGRLRFDQVVDDVLIQQKNSHAAFCAAKGIDPSSQFDGDQDQELPIVNSRAEIEAMFEKLAESRFFIPAPSRSSYVASEETLRSEVIRQEKAVKSNKIMQGDSNGVTFETLAAKETSSSNGKVTVKRPRLANASVDDMSMLPVEVRAAMALSAKAAEAEESEGAPPAKSSRVVRGGRGGRGRGGRGSGGASGRGKEQEEAKAEATSKEVGEASAPMGPRKDVLWAIGWAQLADEERNALCSSVTLQRMGVVGASAVRLLLANQAGGGKSGSMGAYMNVVEIHKGLREQNRRDTAEGKGDVSIDAIDLKTLSMLLEAMRCDSTGVVDKVMIDDKGGGRSPHYLVNKASILQAVRRRLIHAIAEERFGYQSARIVELLQCKSHLEQQKISDMAILPAKEGRERLYDLYRNQWVDYVEISKRGDFNPSNTYFFWTLSTDKLVTNLLNAQYGTVYNLRCRYAKEMADGKPLLDFSDKITDAEEMLKFDKLSESLDRLDNAVLKIIENVTVLGIL